jgi:2'-5' RNA ligase
MKEIYIVITLNKKLNKKFEQYRKEIYKMFNIKYRDRPLHITLRSSFFLKNNDYNKLIKDLKKIKIDSKINLEIKDFDFFRNRILVFKFNKNKNLEELERKVINTAQKYIIKNIKPKKRSKYLDEKQNFYLLEYEDPYIFEYYVPHMSLLYNCNKKIKNIKEYIKDKDYKISFKTNNISIIEKTENKNEKNKIDHKIIKNIKIC